MMRKGLLFAFSFVLVPLLCIPFFFPERAVAFNFEKTSPISKGSFRITAYTNGKSETGKNPGDPGYGITASGTRATPNRTIAVDPSVIPLGSVVQIDGFSGYFVAEDTGRAIKGNDIDMFYATQAEIQNYPNPHRNVTIVGKVDLKTLGGTMTGGGGIGGAPNLPPAKEGELIQDNFRAELATLKENSGILDRFLIGQAENLFSIGGINSLQNLVFGNPYKVWMDSKDSKILYGLFYEQEFEKVIKPLMAVFASSYAIFVTLSIMLASLKLGFRAMSPQGRADFWTDVNMWVISAFFMGTFIWLTEVMYGFNEGITQAIKSQVEKQGGDLTGLSVIAFASGFTVGDIFVFLAEWGLAVYMNIIYVARKLLIIFLNILAPVAAISLLYAKTRYFFGSWIREMLGNVFLPSIHAIVLGVFALMSSLGTAGTLYKLAMIIMFVPITGLLSRWLQLTDSSTTLGKVAAMTGVSTIAGTMMLARKAGNIAEGMRTRSMGSGISGTAGGYNNDNAGTGILEAAVGSNSQGWQRLKTGAGLLGTVAGATFFSPFGMAGSAIGGAIGEKLGKGALQLPRNLVAGSANLVNNALTMPRQFSSEQREGVIGMIQDVAEGLPRMWQDLSARRQFMGNMGEALGTMVGAGTFGRAMGHMLSGASRNRIMAEQFGNRTLEDYARQYPGAAIQWRQDNQGSAFYIDRGDGNWQRISPLGAADSSLRNGEQRRIDYQLNNGNPWIRQENGSYTLGEFTNKAPLNSSVSGNTALTTVSSSTSNALNAVSQGVTAATGNNPLVQQSQGIQRATLAPQTASLSSGINASTVSTSASLVGSTQGQTTRLAQLAQDVPVSVTPASGSGGTSSNTIAQVATGQIRDTRQVVGFSGSTAQLARVSGAYIQASDGKRYEDRRIDPRNINPDSYFSFNAQGVGDQRSMTDKGADMIHSVNRVAAASWTRGRQLISGDRHRGIV
ncbi:3D domain-containing protein [Aneurinibacillus thermoaerophilus]|uniref:3D domain-containing protein n=1 Tax=Aneurinibacillus thermoaerophilus TaxID=143495 RepID=UPI002E22E8D4|nr:3D domain-containing protein [Aneurinibacillus thermoaerophilus]MED0677064.1 3D domain-containing protein [Aneurinibacillus thermoaerophilus]